MHSVLQTNPATSQKRMGEARETGSQSTEQKFKQSGLTVAITSPVLSALQTVQSQLQAAGNTSSGRMQALAGANAAFNLKQAADAVQAGQTIQSLQDTNQYKESSKSAGGSVMVGAGTTGSVSGSINSNYQSVGERLCSGCNWKTNGQRKALK